MEELSSILGDALSRTSELLGTPMRGELADGTEVESVVWDIPDITDAGRGRQLGRSFWIFTDCPELVTRGLLFVGPSPVGGVDRTWRIDQRGDIEPGKVQALVVVEASS